MHISHLFCISAGSIATSLHFCWFYRIFFALSPEKNSRRITDIPGVIVNLIKGPAA
ncbi:MAG TPA: hypothetical protein VIK55_07160 [Paludibacter sp.]